jgi:hypothetical protein
MVIGFLIGKKYQAKLLVLASFLVLCAWTIAATTRQSFSVIDVLLLFSYLSSLQGGFLIGAYIQTSREEKRIL